MNYAMEAYDRLAFCTKAKSFGEKEFFTVCEAIDERFALLDRLIGAVSDPYFMDMFEED